MTCGVVIEEVKALGLNARRSNQLSVWRSRAGCVYMQMTSGCVYIYERSPYHSISCTVNSHVTNRNMQHAMLNPTLICEITPWAVKLTRKRDIYRRTVYLPLEIFNVLVASTKIYTCLADGEERLTVSLLELNQSVSFATSLLICDIKHSHATLRFHLNHNIYDLGITF